MSALPLKPHRIGCDCDEKALHRLAPTFPALSWAGGPHAYDLDDAANVLMVQGADVRALCDAGVFRATMKERGWGREYFIPTTELVRFLEQHGEWWFQQRLRKQIEALRQQAPDEAPLTEEPAEAVAT